MGRDMRTLGTCGYLLLLLLIFAAFVAWRRSRDAAAPPASFSPGAAPFDAEGRERGPPWGGDAPLAFERDLVDLGVLSVGEGRSAPVRWRRRGTGPLKVRAVRTGCGCVVAGGLPDVVPEGAEGVLTVEVRGRTMPGPFTHVIHVVTDRPPDDVLRLVVRGFVGDAVVVAPGTFSLGSVPPGAVVDRAVTVRPPPDADAKDVAATFVGVEGDWQVTEPLERGAHGADVLLAFFAPIAPGPFSGEVEIRVGVRGVWRIRVTGDVARPVPHGARR